MDICVCFRAELGQILQQIVESYNMLLLD